MAERGGIDRMRRDRACDAVRRGAQRVRDAQRTAEQGGRIICRVSVSVGIYEAQRHVERLRRFFQYAITDCRCGRNDGRERQPRETLRIECCINACGKRFIRVDSPRIDADHDAARMNHEFVARTAPCVGVTRIACAAASSRGSATSSSHGAAPSMRVDAPASRSDTKRLPGRDRRAHSLPAD